MATNTSMIQLLERTSELIEELNANNKRIKRHISAQKSQKGQFWNDSYVYDKDKKETRRIKK